MTFVKFAALMTMIFCPACSSPPTNNPDHLKISDLRPTVNTLPPPQDAGLVSMPGMLPARAVITRLEVPRDVTLQALWALTDQRNLPPAIVELWRKNGLRVGLVDAARSRQLLAAIPDALSTCSQLRIRAPFACPVWLNPPIHDPHRVELTLGPGTSQHVMPEFTAGRFQMLIRLADAENDRVTVELRPHLFAPEQSILVRTPMERDLDGVIFNQLTLNVTLAPNQLLVISPDVPPPPTRTLRPHPATQPEKKVSGTFFDGKGQPPPITITASTQPSKPPPITSRSSQLKVPDTLSSTANQLPVATLPKPLPPPKLGEMILTAETNHQPIQAIWVIATHHSNPVSTATASR